MALQDLRALVAERSLMKTYIRGETIEVPHQSIGFLLEGFIKPFSVQEEITSPAILLPSHENQSFQNADMSGATTASSSHQFETRGSIIYQVETRARVIIFYIATLEVEGVLHISSSSFDHSHSTLSREHGGLMCWPENFYKARQHTHGATDQQENRLFDSAMQLSIFGSMVDAQWRCRSLSRMNLSQPTHSLSYPRLPATLRKNLEARKFTAQISPKQVKDSDKKEGHVNDDSRDESVAEDEIQIRIDSPSRPSFRQAS